MPITSSETDPVEIAGGCDSISPETFETFNISKLSAALTQAYLKARKALIDRASSEYRGAIAKNLNWTRIITELVGWAERGEDLTDSHEVLVKVFQMAGLNEKQQEILRSLIASQITIIEGMLDAIYDQMDHESGQVVEHFKLKQAEFNQKLATYLYLMLQRTRTQRVGAVLLSDLAIAIGKSEMDDRHLIISTINGARAQAGICHALDQAGCRVLLPDYNNPKELTDWDLNGVDLVAITPYGKILLIDAKGRESIQTDTGPISNRIVTLEEKEVAPVHVQVATEAAEFDEVQNQKAIDRSRTRVVRLKITVPTAPELMSSLGKLGGKIERSLLRKLELN